MACLSGLSLFSGGGFQDMYVDLAGRDSLDRGGLSELEESKQATKEDEDEDEDEDEEEGEEGNSDSEALSRAVPGQASGSRLRGGETPGTPDTMQARPLGEMPRQRAS
ncbi:hypothetical protein L249_5004 [Ophiocordyceps polyrhachis-furcata BCC 54312]|uniref:Uncharacterized protein n=1 Tax=Ophiocordyceps polyrhachis-furcata BCC 54312 TaxID=1330021 RepID=A0A367L357_9HYPO|nr:hypothetical protein L249_5004 [Ophiocordyceps polyrhachis-furcata BCC 54312]